MKHRLALPLALAGLLVTAVPTLAAPGQEGEPQPEKRILRKVHKAGGEPGSPEVFFLPRQAFGGGGFLGVQLVDMTPELRRHMGAPEDTGVLVSKVEEGSAAAQAGIQVGDVLTKIAGEPVRHPLEARTRISPVKDGEQVDVEVWRDGHPLSLRPTIKAREGVAEMPGNFHFKLASPGEGAVHAFKFMGEDGEVVELENLEGFNWVDVENRLGDFFQSPQWKENLEKMQANRGDMQKRIDALEKRLKELETQLQGLNR